MMQNFNRVGRAVENFNTHPQYTHRIILDEQTRLDWNTAFEWCIAQFGEPGERWDFYYEHEWEKHGRSKWIGWSDIFGFRDSADATLFVLRWTQ